MARTTRTRKPAALSMFQQEYVDANTAFEAVRYEIPSNSPEYDRLLNRLCDAFRNVMIAEWDIARVREEFLIWGRQGDVRTLITPWDHEIDATDFHRLVDATVECFLQERE